jgi:hypothetical protein
VAVERPRDNWVGKPSRKRALATVSRPSGLRSCRAQVSPLSSSFKRWERHAPSPLFEKGERQNRRAFGTAAGEKLRDDERSCSEFAGFSPVTGDPIACRSASKKRYRLSRSVFAPLRLCAFASLRYRAGGWICVICVICGQLGWAGALRLCVSAPLRFILCVLLCFSVPLW